MPSIIISDSPDSLMDSKKLKQKKSKKIDSMDLEPEALSNGHSIDEPKPEKKKKKKEKKIDSDGELATEEKVKKKRRKASDEESSDIEEKVKKSKLVEKEDDPNALSKFRISHAVKEKLVSKGIESLFPIQAMTFNVILDGSDLVGRARTGQMGLSNHDFWRLDRLLSNQYYAPRIPSRRPSRSRRARDASAEPSERRSETPPVPAFRGEGSESAQPSPSSSGFSTITEQRLVIISDYYKRGDIPPAWLLDTSGCTLTPEQRLVHISDYYRRGDTPPACLFDSSS